MKKGKIKWFLAARYFFIAAALSIFCLTLSACADYGALQDKLDEAIRQNEKQSEAILAIGSENEELKEKNSAVNAENENLKSEIEGLKSQLDDNSSQEMENQPEDPETQPEELKKMLNNMNDLLRYVYIGSSSPDELAYTFTAFTIAYKGKTYIITAGHCVADNYGEEGLFKFKANFSDTWVYPDLLGYKAEFYNLDDYGVFYTDGMSGGFAPSDIVTEDLFLLGSLDKGLSIVRNLGDSSKRGESGSPVINENGDVVGIYVVYGFVYTPIQLALDLIDNTVID